MRRLVQLACAFFVVLLVMVPAGRDAIVDDFEDDFWMSFTHFHLGDRATAGYSDALAHSGARSFRVEIHGWTVRDFGSAYGYAVFSTRGAPLGELRLVTLYDSLQDTSPSPWDSFTAGISLELLGPEYRSLGTYRYVTAYRASQNAGRCAPTLSDVVLGDRPGLNVWQEIGRNPSADFSGAPWRDAAYVKVSVGFLCAAGLTGASYSMYFDDFVLESDSGDADGDGLRDLDEETRVYAVQLSESAMPVSLPSEGEANITLRGPAVSGQLLAGFVAVDLVHPRPDDLSVSLVIRNGTEEVSQVLWDPRAFERGVAVTSPAPGDILRGTVLVAGRVSPIVADGWVRLLVNGVPRPVQPLGRDGTFALPWPTDGLAEGPVTIGVDAIGSEVEGGVVVSSTPLTVFVDRTPPELALTLPVNGSSASGLVRISANAYDSRALVSVELFVDGVRADGLEHEPFEFSLESADLANTEHRLEVRATDAAGNVAVRWVTVKVANRDTVPPPTCYPACNLTRGATTGNLAPVRTEPRSWSLAVASGARLDLSEGLRVPWQPSVLRTSDGISLDLSAVRGGYASSADGAVASVLPETEFAGSGLWQIVVRDHGAGDAGFVGHASVRFAARTSLASADTDGDGLSDGAERALPSMCPVLADIDGDGLSDGWESVPHLLRYTVDGEQRVVAATTGPLDPDTDDDGVADGDEVDPPAGWNVTNPNDPDTDTDGVTDGAERYTYGSDPTLTDTDGDTLRDGSEVTPRTLSLVIDGVAEVRPVVTNPALRDTDDDGLTDDQEWNGGELWGLATDASDQDTDHDGLTDGDEIRGTNRRPTNPLLSDSDSDRLVDGLDLAPTETWSFPWSHSFEPGLVRFTQTFRALDVHGAYAAIWTYNGTSQACEFTSDHTADATRSSDESAASVGTWINKTFLQGGETNYTALGMSYVGVESTDESDYQRGACDGDAPRRYIIRYRHDNHLWDVDFVNVAAVNVSDEEGTFLDHALVEVPLVPNTYQSIIVQISLPADKDLGMRTQGSLIVPAFQYALHRDMDFLAAPPFYRSIAVGTNVDNHSYQFVLRIPREVATAENGTPRNGELYALLDVMPVWLTSYYGFLTKAALNASAMTVGAVITRIEQSAERVLARLDVDLVDLNAVLPEYAATEVSGLHAYGPYSVYLYRLGEVIDEQLFASVDAVWLSGGTEEELAEFQSSLTWSPREDWVRDGWDALGMELALMKIIRRGISLTSQLTSGIVATTAAVPAWTWNDLTYLRSYKVATTVNGIDWQPIFVVEYSGTRTVNVATFDPSIEYEMTDSYCFSVELGNAEIVDDLRESKILAGPSNINLRTALQGAAIGATLVIFGSQAIVAYAEGDLLKGSVYSAAGGISIFGIVKSNVVLGQRLPLGGTIGRGLTLRFGTVAVVAVGGILASYELFLAGEADNRIEKLAHYEAASASMLDTLISVIPLYGPGVAIGWQLGIGAAVGIQSLAGIVPDRLAAAVTSSPGRTIVFLFEYVLGEEIPSDIAEDALITLLNTLADAMRFLNSMGPPSPTILVAP